MKNFTVDTLSNMDSWSYQFFMLLHRIKLISREAYVNIEPKRSRFVRNRRRELLDEWKA